MSTQEMTQKIRQILELKRMAEEISAEMEALTDEIKGEMAAQNTDTLLIDVYKVTWKPTTSTRIDSASLKKALPEVYEQYSKQTTSKRFLIN